MKSGAITFATKRGWWPNAGW